MTIAAARLAGRFIVLDGPDGTGKSTQLELLARQLSADGADVLRTRDPGGTPIGDRIRHILLDHSSAPMAVGCEVMLYMASRAQLWHEVIAPALAARKCVLCDRWVSSTVAYQVAGSADEQAVMHAYGAVLPGVQPDLTVILDIDPELGLKRAADRRSHDRIEARGIEYHRRVRELFLSQAARSPDHFAVVPADATVEQVHRQVVRAVEKWANG
jgi:dTMP kinase